MQTTQFHIFLFFFLLNGTLNVKLRKTEFVMDVI